jgi:branched-chain amino acid transport system substrate-binding protein
MAATMLRSIRRALKAVGLALVVAVPIGAQSREVMIGVFDPLTGPAAQAGVDAEATAELAVEIVNGRHDLDVPRARTEGLPALGGANVRLVMIDHHATVDVLYPLPKWSERK